MATIYQVDTWALRPGPYDAAAHDLGREARRVDRWAGRLTRLTGTSDLALPQTQEWLT